MLVYYTQSSNYIWIDRLAFETSVQLDFTNDTNVCKSLYASISFKLGFLHNANAEVIYHATNIMLLIVDSLIERLRCVLIGWMSVMCWIWLTIKLFLESW